MNHGNSGGPLLSTTTGQVVGLVDAARANGIAFAVSAEVAEPLLHAWAAAPQPPAQANCWPAGSSDVGEVPDADPAAAYVNDVDSALIDSARTRGDLGDLIDGVNEGTLTETEARADITSIIDQRRQLLQEVTDVPSAAPFTLATALLRSSLVAAVTDDLAIENWIKATYRSDEAAAS